MKIAIPTNGKRGLNEDVAQHFGRCNTYTIIDENGRLLEIIDNTSEHMGGFGLPPDLMKKHGTDMLLCMDIGPRAIIMCKNLGIDVYLVHAKTVKEMFEKWKSGKIKKAELEDTCKQHRENQ